MTAVGPIAPSFTWRGLVRGGRLIASIAWYPTLLAVAYVLEIVVHAEVRAAGATRALVLAVGVPLLITLGVRALVRHRERSGVVAAVIVVALLVVGDLPSFAPFPAALAIIGLVGRWEVRGRLRLPWGRVHELLTIVAVLLVLVAVARFAQLGATRPQPTLDAAWAVVPSLPAGSIPDLFIVVADGHGRADVLRDRYGYDPSPFLAALREDGFTVSTQGRANYLYTRFSLASLLSGAHLADLGQDLDASADDVLVYEALQRNPAFSLLHRLGYETIAVSSGYEHVAIRTADRFVDTGQPNELEEVIFANTAVGRVQERLFPKLGPALLRERTLAGVDMLRSIADEPAASTEVGPQLVLVHLPSPHRPFVFGAACSLSQADGDSPGLVKLDGHAGTDESVVATAHQTSCVDGLLADVLDEVVADRPDAVVILLSDHGPDERLDWWAPEPLPVLDRSAILFAARTPGHPDLFPDDVTLVNVLPILFNAYLGTDLPLRPDDVYFGPDPATHRFFPVGTDGTIESEPAGQSG